MGFFDKFLNAIKLNDDFDDDDFLDDEDEELDDEDDFEDRSHVKGSFFARFRRDDDDEDDDDYDDEPPARRKTSRTSSVSKSEQRKSTSSGASRSASSSARTSALRSQAGSSAGSLSRRATRSSTESGSSTSSRSVARRQKVTPIKRRTGDSTVMEVSVIRPSSMEDTREIADTLMDNCTVILNLEGLDFDIAQRVIDFACGVCYSLHGNLQKVSGYIFILTPPDVDISGDYQSILDGVFDLPSLKLSY